LICSVTFENSRCFAARFGLSFDISFYDEYESEDNYANLLKNIKIFIENTFWFDGELDSYHITILKTAANVAKNNK